MVFVKSCVAVAYKVGMPAMYEYHRARIERGGHTALVISSNGKDEVVEFLNAKAEEGWVLVAPVSHAEFLFRREKTPSVDDQSVSERRAWKRLNEAEELLVQAFNEWTPTQGPKDKWLSKVKKIKESREY